MRQREGGRSMFYGLDRQLLGCSKRVICWSKLQSSLGGNVMGQRQI